jgi:hypothetical protein
MLPPAGNSDHLPFPHHTNPKARAGKQDRTFRAVRKNHRKNDCRKESKSMKKDTLQLLPELLTLVILAFIAKNNDAPVSIMITLQALNSLKEG